MDASSEQGLSRCSLSSPRPLAQGGIADGSVGGFSIEMYFVGKEMKIEEVEKVGLWVWNN